MDNLKNVVGTPPGSLISLIIPPRAKLRHTIRMLNDERTIALGILSETRRNRMVDVIERTIRIVQRYDQPNEILENGLAVFAGTDIEGNIIEVAFEPRIPIDTSLYILDTKFHGLDYYTWYGYRAEPRIH